MKNKIIFRPNSRPNNHRQHWGNSQIKKLKKKSPKIPRRKRSLPTARRSQKPPQPMGQCRFCHRRPPRGIEFGNEQQAE